MVNHRYHLLKMFWTHQGRESRTHRVPEFHDGFGPAQAALCGVAVPEDAVIDETGEDWRLCNRCKRCR